MQGTGSHKWLATVLGLLSCIFILFITSCEQKKAQTESTPISVTAYTVKAHDVPLILEYIGLTQSILSIDLVARVKGYLVTRNFREGSLVTKGELMYVIDQRQYIAELEQAKAALLQAQAEAQYLQHQAERMTRLVNQGAVSREQYDQAVSNAKAAVAKIAQAKAQVRQAKLNLSYTTVYTPISGRVSDTFVDVGNLVGNTGDTKLANIVQLDPIYIVFNPSDKDFLLMRKYLRLNKGLLPVTATYPDEGGKVFSGTLDFVNNQVDQQTSTVKLRATIKNPNSDLLPGLYMKVYVHVTTLKNQLTIPTEAIVSGQDISYAFIIGSNNKAIKQPITLGRTVKEQTIVLKGLKVGDKVITNNLQVLRDGMVVTDVPQSKSSLLHRLFFSWHTRRDT